MAPKETEYVIKSAALVNGKEYSRKFGGFSTTVPFSELMLHDLAEEEFKKEFPGAKIEIQSVEMNSI